MDYIPLGRDVIDVLLRVSNWAVSIFGGLVELFQTPVASVVASMSNKPALAALLNALSLFGTLIGIPEITILDFLFMAIPLILLLSIVKWLIGIVT